MASVEGRRVSFAHISLGEAELLAAVLRLDRADKGHRALNSGDTFYSGHLGQSRENPKELFIYQICKFLTLMR